MYIYPYSLEYAIKYKATKPTATAPEPLSAPSMKTMTVHGWQMTAKRPSSESTASTG